MTVIALEQDFLTWLKSTIDKATAANYTSILDDLTVSVQELKTTGSHELAQKLSVFIDKKWTRLFAVKKLLTYYNRQDVIAQLPRAKSIRRERLLKRKSISFTDIRSVVDAEKDDQLKLEIMLQYETGSRISEILDITTDDIDHINKKVTVGGKKGSYARTIKLSDETFNLLSGWIKVGQTGKVNSRRVFSYRYERINRKLKRAFSAVSRQVSTHWLRTSRAVHLFEKGYSVLQIKEFLGHKSIEATYKYLREAGIDITAIVEKTTPVW